MHVAMIKSNDKNLLTLTKSQGKKVADKSTYNLEINIILPNLKY